MSLFAPFAQASVPDQDDCRYHQTKQDQRWNCTDKPYRKVSDALGKVTPTVYKGGPKPAAKAVAFGVFGVIDDLVDGKMDGGICHLTVVAI